MRKQLFSLGITLTSLSMVGGIAYAATQSVSTRPAPQVVVPAAGEHARGADDQATTTIVPDDRGGSTTTPATPGATPTTAATATTRPTIPTTATTPVTVDDRGRGRSGLDDAVSSTVPTTRSTTIGSTPSTVVDDHGRQAELSDDRGGSSSSGSSGSGSGGTGSGKSGR